MSQIEFTNTAATTTAPSLTRYTLVNDYNNSSIRLSTDTLLRIDYDSYTDESGTYSLFLDRDFDYLTHEVIGCYLAFGYGDRGYWTAVVNVTDPTYANLVPLGTIEGTRLFLVTYIDGGKLYYMVLDETKNTIEPATVLGDADAITGIHIANNGDAVITFADDSVTNYVKIDSGYNIAPVANPVTLTNQSASDALTIAADALGTDPDEGPLQVTAGSTYDIVTSSSGTRSALAVVSADGSLVVLYTGKLEAGETATVTFEYTIYDGEDGDRDYLTVEFTGTGSSIVDLTVSEAQALINSGYTTLHSISSTLTGFNLIDTAEHLQAVAASDFAALSTLGISEISVSSASADFSIAQLEAIAAAGLTFDTAAGAIHLQDSVANLAGLTATTLAIFVVIGVTEVGTTGDAAITLSLDAALGFASSSLTLEAGDTITIAATDSEILALSARDLASLADAGATLIDLTTDTITVSRSAYDQIIAAGLAFAADDVVTIEAVATNTLTLADDSASPEAGIESVTVNVLANDHTSAGSVSLVGASLTSGSGQVIVNADGSLSVTYTGDDLDEGETATVTVTYGVTDGTSTGSAHLTVTFSGDANDGNDGNPVRQDGSSAGDILRGTDGADALYGLAGADELRGGAGDDLLFGGRGRDSLFGGSGDDMLHGGRGNDRLTGGAGIDTFVFASGTGHDRVMDFETTGTDHDLIDLSAFGLTGFEDLAGAIVERHGNAVITLPDGGKLTLVGVDPEALTVDHFLF